MKNKIKNQVRQGDVLVTPTSDSPKAPTKVQRENGKVILAHGEVTGHHHALMEPGVELVQEDNERFLIVPPGGAPLTHQEHATIPVRETFSPRKVIRQSEYSDDLSRQVTD